MITDDQIKQIEDLRADAVMHYNSIEFHMKCIERLAECACDVLSIDPKSNPWSANIARAVVINGSDPKNVGERIRVSEANRKLYEAAEQDSQDEVTL